MNTEIDPDCINTLPFSPVKAEIASSNLVGVANLIEEYGEIKGGKMARQSAREYITLDAIKTICESHPNATPGEIMQLVSQKVSEDLITTADACDAYNLNQSTIASWIMRGHISIKKIVPNSKSTGRPTNLLSRKELESYITNRPGRGRPKKPVAV